MGLFSSVLKTYRGISAARRGGRAMLRINRRLLCQNALYETEDENNFNRLRIRS
jgi:hypothetical protein